MIERYANPRIAQIWSDENKIRLWQETELPVIKTKEAARLLPDGTSLEIHHLLGSYPCDIDWWKEKEREIGHDLQAWVEERRRQLGSYGKYFHDDAMTSFDTEEPAFARMLKACTLVVLDEANSFGAHLAAQAKRHRFTIMLGRTHGQWAELQTFGKQCLTWLVQFEEAKTQLIRASENLKFSKLSGAIGNYTGLSPELEAAALQELDLSPFYGATQIMPRTLYTPIAHALANMVLVLHKIALDIRLAARSGNPILREPRSKRQKGSSAMPQKQNPIILEQMEGMARMAVGYAGMIQQNIPTWEERSIEQSCVERVAWPDLFHVVMNCLTKMTRVIQELRVYPKAMWREIAQSRGTYAASHAKTFLANHGFSAEEAYKIVQLAAFSVTSEGSFGTPQRGYPLAKQIEDEFATETTVSGQSIEHFILEAKLCPHPELDVSEAVTISWNERLTALFWSDKGDQARNAWKKIFEPDYLLRNEAFLFEKVLGE